ncbi:MAG: Rrf2 family transcriptional regulator [Treponema sp.]|jgi:Rrf2 family protein|nr:Rrf2 family transcriptional regulator [Treponema sp.]
MLITRESDYAARILRELYHAGRERVEDICRNEQIPRQYSYKIVKKLEKAGLVKIYRGAGGGCELAREIGGITLFDIIAAVEGEFLLAECLGRGFHCSRYAKGNSRCRVHEELLRIQGLILKQLQEKSLKDIFERYF